jgi:hypothetical protein
MNKELELKIRTVAELQQAAKVAKKTTGKNYDLRIWAEEGAWHCKAVFSPPIGNTGEAERIFNNARATASRNLRRIASNGAKDGYRFKLNVESARELSTGQLLWIVWVSK